MLHTAADGEIPHSYTCFLLQRLQQGKHYDLLLSWTHTASGMSGVPTRVASASDGSDTLDVHPTPLARSTWFG